MLKLRFTTIIIALNLAACNTLPERQADASLSDTAPAAISVTQSTDFPAKKAIKNISAASQEPNVVEPPVYDDVWLRIRDKLSLHNHINQASVKARVSWYARHQAYLDRVSERARPYLYHIVEELEKRDMPVELALLPIVESAYHPFAYSRSHASGIWQFIPGTGRHYGLKQNWWYDGRRDIVAATDAALRYLDKLNKEFKGDWLHALAAYNTGERKVGRSISRNLKAGKPTDFWSLRLPRETRGYVPSLLAIAEILANPDKYGVKWQAIENKSYFSEVDVQEQLDLATAAQLADISMDEIYTLNPAFNRWATDPDGPHRLLIPIAKNESFKAELAKLSDAERITWKRHIIKRGESLGLIAQNYHTSVSALKQTNKIRNTLIREGQSLLIPSSKHPLKHYTLSLDSRRYRGLKKSGDGKNHIYTVRRGDTLWDIGRQYGVSIKELCSWNGISSRSILRPGKKLNLWLTANETKTAKAIPVNYESTNANSINYTVKKGDSLWLIARRHNVTVKQLLAWNGITRKKHLKPGQQLLIQNGNNKITGV
jgi:peptidoglycan lytic transglycosylase D